MTWWTWTLAAAIFIGLPLFLVVEYWRPKHKPKGEPPEEP